MSNFYPRPPRGGRRAQAQRAGPRGTISIHALREEGDSGMRSGALNRSNFYPRPPRGGRRHNVPQLFFLGLFLSTPSARRATVSGCVFFLPASISIHALREEGDLSSRPVVPSTCQFLSTPSARRATWCRTLTIRQSGNFYPRPPRGGRRHRHGLKFYAGEFLSTPSARRATREMCDKYGHGGISIHALREEGDSSR